MENYQEKKPENSIVIAGVGLIGGSIAAAVRHRFPACRVLGVGRHADRLQRAQQAGLLTSWSTEVAPSVIPAGSLGVVCVPVDQISATARLLLEVGCEVVTDAGSVKGTICNALSAEFADRFVGAHPIAGSEQSGFEYSDATLFVNKLCVVTPYDITSDAVRRVARFWESIGAVVQMMSMDEHDRILALTSHLPHILASVAAGCVEEELLPFTGSGYRDTTRIAAGSASLWTSILLGNAHHCVESVLMAEELLRRFREAIASNDAATLVSLWESSARRRERLRL